MKRIIAVALCFIIISACSVCGFTTAAQTDNELTVYDLKDRFIGDLNGDGYVTVQDIVILRKTLFGFENENNVSGCDDLNGDGRIDIIDFISVKKYVAFSLETVYLSAVGSDNNSGSEDAPVRTLKTAIDKVSCGGTVVIVGEYDMTSSDAWGSRMKKVTVTGGTLDMSALSVIRMGNAVSFDNITLTFLSNATLYACGYPFEIGANVTVNGTITVFGGDTSAVYKTNVKLLSGNYNKIYGGGNGADVTASTNLYVGGTVNSGISDITAHSKTHYVVGGSNGAACGETNLTFTDNAGATMLFGGGLGVNSTVKRTNLNVSGGKMMGIYGGSDKGSCNETNVTITGGNVEQIFGANEASSMTGNANVNILGGTVTRRIQGGCYNEVVRNGISIDWKSSNYVTGNTTVTISENANITLDYNTDSYDDLGISATSRYKTAFADENATIVFTSTAAETMYKSKLGISTDDWVVNLVLKFASPYDNYTVLS